jgi:hypothetical protein
MFLSLSKKLVNFTETIVWFKQGHGETELQGKGKCKVVPVLHLAPFHADRWGRAFLTSMLDGGEW